MTVVRLYLFGAPRIEFEGQEIKVERRKALALAAYLAMAEQPQSRDVVAGLLWPDLDHEHARSALRSTLRALTTPIAADWIEADRNTLALKPEMAWVDVNTFTDLLIQRSSHDHDNDSLCADCVTLYQQALDLYRSDFLSGFHLPDSMEYSDWQRSQSDWLRRELAGIMRRLAYHEAKNEHFEQAIVYARRWLSLDELHEPAHQLLMQLFASSGQRSAALRQYQQCVDLLKLELASPPEDETTHLYESILHNQFSKTQISGLNPAPSISALPPLPSLVVGRVDALQTIRQRLGIGGDGRPVTMIQGWPGVGKSTIVALIAHDPEIARHFPDGVLWASLGEDPDISGEISTWASALKLSDVGHAPRIEEMSAQITAALREKRILLIVDDIWQAEHAAPFRVGGQSSALIMTTRLNDVASALAPTAEDIYRLPVLTETAGLELLSKLTPQTTAQYPTETRELIRDLEGLPLAIHVAGRLLQSEVRLGWGISDLLVELREGAKLLLAQPPSDMLGVSRDTLPTVAALLKRSTDALEPEMRVRFALLGLFVPKPATFDLEAMAATWDTSDPRPPARKLVDHGLLEPVGGGRFQMHALLVLHARSLLETELGSLE